MTGLGNGSNLSQGRGTNYQMKERGGMDIIRNNGCIGQISFAPIYTFPFLQIERVHRYEFLFITSSETTCSLINSGELVCPSGTSSSFHAEVRSLLFLS